jgi:pimeloyl-ACP methyl ester carboxylesterase
MPIAFIYGGAADWMDADAGARVVEAVLAGGGRATVQRVWGAGHQLMLDDPAGFLRAVLVALGQGCGLPAVGGREL